MIKDLIEKAKQNSDKQIGQTHYLNPNWVDKVISNVQVLELKSFYPNLLLQMTDSGLVDKSERTNMGKIKESILKNDEDSKYFVNSYFGKLYKRDTKSVSILLQYVRNFWEDLNNNLNREKLSDDVIFWDVDTIYCKNLNNLILESFKKLDIEYQIWQVEYFYIKRIKNFVCYNNSEFWGIPEPDSSIKSKILEVRRNDILENLTNQVLK